MRSTTLVASMLVASIWAAPPCARAQQLRFGIIGGTNLTPDFHSVYEQFTYPGIPELEGYWINVLFYSKSHSVIFGPSMEISLPRGLSVEVNAMHRNLQSIQDVSDPSGTHTDHFVAAKTWEFPVLLKYALPVSRVRPFVEAGPSFRVWQQPQRTEPSNYGITAGIGAEINWKKFRFAPMVRYTRWASDARFPLRTTNPDQVEVLGSMSYHTESESRRLAGRKLWIGLIGGPALTSGFHSGHYGYPLDESQPFAAGLALELELKGRWSVEVDGLYRPMHAETLYPQPDGTVFRNPFSVLTWQFSVLAKYRLSKSRLAPFVQGGPAVRLSGNTNGYNPSRIGATVGVGIEAARFGPFRFVPVVRYSRYRKDGSPYGSPAFDGARTAPNQVDVLVSFSF